VVASWARQRALKGDVERDDLFVMQPEDAVGGGCHFAGVNTWLLARYLRDNGGPNTVERLLREGR
jgi:hypothetical protein